METSLLPAAELWPKALPVTGHRPPDGMVTLEIPCFSEAPLLTALSRAVHLEMRAAGEWAARIGEPREKGVPGPREFSDFRAENAARLLAIYAGLHGAASYLSALDLTPEALKESATRSYNTALRGARLRRPSPTPVPASSISQN